MCACVCVVITFILGVRHHVDTSAGVTQEESHTVFQPSISLVDREVEFCVPTINGIIPNSLFGEYAKSLDRGFVEVVA